MGSRPASTSATDRATVRNPLITACAVVLCDCSRSCFISCVAIGYHTGDPWSATCSTALCVWAAVPSSCARLACFVGEMHIEPKLSSVTPKSLTLSVGTIPRLLKRSGVYLVSRKMDEARLGSLELRPAGALPLLQHRRHFVLKYLRVLLCRRPHDPR